MESLTIYGLVIALVPAPEVLKTSSPDCHRMIRTRARCLPRCSSSQTPSSSEQVVSDEVLQLRVRRCLRGRGRERALGEMARQIRRGFLFSKAQGSWHAGGGGISVLFESDHCHLHKPQLAEPGGEMTINTLAAAVLEELSRRLAKQTCSRASTRLSFDVSPVALLPTSARSFSRDAAADGLGELRGVQGFRFVVVFSLQNLSRTARFRDIRTGLRMARSLFLTGAVLLCSGWGLGASHCSDAVKKSLGRSGAGWHEPRR